MSSIIDLNGQKHGVMADPEAFLKDKERWEKRLNRTWEEFTTAIQPSEVAKPDVKGLFETFNHRWKGECETAERGGFHLDREALQRRYDALEAQRARRALFTGPITPEALSMIGFRKWSDGSYRTMELMVEPIGTDWRLNITADLFREYNMGHIIRLMDVVEIKNLTPFYESQLPPAPRPLFRRILDRFKTR